MAELYDDDVDSRPTEGAFYRLENLSAEQLEDDTDVKSSTLNNTVSHQWPEKTWQFWTAVCMLYLCQLLSAIDSTVLSTALPQISQELRGATILTFWCQTSFILTKTVSQPSKISSISSLTCSIRKYV